MAGYLLRWLQEGMLLLWDRNFKSYKNLSQVLSRKAHLLARSRRNLVFEPIEADRRRWWEDLLAEVGEEALPQRRDRVNPRVLERKMSKGPKKRPQHRHPPPPAKPFRDSIVIT
jgi:hypothetical protein